MDQEDLTHEDRNCQESGESSSNTLEKELPADLCQTAAAQAESVIAGLRQLTQNELRDLDQALQDLQPPASHADGMVESGPEQNPEAERRSSVGTHVLDVVDDLEKVFSSPAGSEDERLKTKVLSDVDNLYRALQQNGSEGEANERVFKDVEDLHRLLTRADNGPPDEHSAEQHADQKPPLTKATVYKPLLASETGSYHTYKPNLHPLKTPHTHRRSEAHRPGKPFVQKGQGPSPVDRILMFCAFVLPLLTLAGAIVYVLLR